MGKSFFVFLMVVLAASLGCQKNQKKSDTENDVTPEVFSRLSGTAYKMRGSIFQMTAANRFQFQYDADVLLLGSLRAHCGYVLTGTVAFKQQSSGLPARARLKAYFELDKVDWVKSFPNFPNDIDSDRICKEYRRLLEKSPRSEHLVYEVDTNYLSFAKLQFDIERIEDNSNVARSRVHHERRDFTAQYNGFYRDYFVAPGVTVDLTESILPVVRGNYSMVRNGDPDISMNVDGTSKSLTFSSRECAFTYSMKIKSVYTDSENTLAYHLETLTQQSDTSAPLGDACARWNTSMRDLTARKSYFGFQFDPWSVGDSLRFLFMLFPSSTPGTDKGYIFEPIR